MAALRGRQVAAIIAGLGLVSWGCSSHVPDRVPAPPIDPSASAAQAMALCDTNHDGVIAGKELDKCPALKSAVKRYSNGDGRITADAIAARLEKMKESKVGIVTLIARVELDGKPVEGATVTLDPEPFMNGSISAASGVTNKDGAASIAIDPQDRFKRGVNPGLYEVRITKIVNGKETIPDRYNKNTELGVEVSQDNLDIESDLHFQLKSQ